jgi:DNA invertase Pin-like site-specific DNA recombinase
LAEFERDLIRERTQAGPTAARARGRQGGRPKALDERKAEIARVFYTDKNNSIIDILPDPAHLAGDAVPLHQART